MRTFAVFGMNEHFAREEAKRKVRDFKIEKGKRIELSMSQWLQAVEDRVVKIMDGKRVAQLSSMFDAPPGTPPITPSVFASWNGAET
ncbi:MULTISPECIES: hypothetical protein [Pseudomonas]|jgi:hypothetical protein|uniref:Uncharacterized protein n=1 Tax=Pseudomonas fluorescens TaxID=294 RepID=A0A5E6VC83_PSEFL|nr:MULTISPECIES: hypothetical protein [Pseudomonas]VVN12704.1 hypothetical protein PS673_03882 [Pseudomonas fluorescens]